MTVSRPMLADCIGIRTRFLRSINLEMDYGRVSSGDDYIVTPACVDILRRVSEGLNPGSTYRAWTITGPYGVGKSAFAVFLTRLLCNGSKGGPRVWKLLEKAAPGVALDLRSKLDALDGSKPWLFPVLVTARRAPAAQCLLEGLQTALTPLKGAWVRTLTAEMDESLRGIQAGSEETNVRVSSLLSSFAAGVQRCGYRGVLLLVDELGKVFEAAAHAPQRSDVGVMQEIAEQASRSGDFPFLFFGFLHQSFDDYGRHLDSITRKEWAKIHGRFEDIAFLEPVDQVIRMIAAAMEWKPGCELPCGLAEKIGRVAKGCSAAGIVPPGMSQSDFGELCLRAYPLHPVTLVALPHIFRRFAQNERSLFSYLGSLEPGGLQEFLRTHQLGEDPEFVRLDNVFDHFTINFGAGLHRQSLTRRWMEAADVLDRKDHLSEEHARIVKVIGVLSALGDFCPLRPVEKIIAAAIDDRPRPSTGLQKGLRALRDSSILTFRAFNETYRIWEGSDIDIDERIAEGRRKLRGVFNLADAMQQFLPPKPVVARRHSFEGGALRFFEMVYVDDPGHLSRLGPPSPGATGQIAVCLATDQGQVEAFRAAAASKGCDRADLIVAVPQQVGELLEMVAELAAMRWAWNLENTPQLRDDRVARRELALRMSEAERFLQRNLGNLLDPRKEPVGSNCAWFWRSKPQKVRNRLQVSQLLSTVSEKVFHAAPRIKNELIVRRSLSSAAAGARGKLVERMLASADKPLLGIEGYPPERSMYESVLAATRLHRESDNGTWGFAAPVGDNGTNLRPAWDEMCGIIFGAQGDPVPLDTLFAALAAPPYGVLDGLHPVLLCAFLQIHRDETTLYRDGSFIPEPGAADFELLLRRPEIFAVAGSPLNEARLAVVERVAKSLKTPAATVPVVRALYRMIASLPELARRTRKLGARTLQVRAAFEKARSPERFLYVELPEALDLPPFIGETADRDAVEEFFQRLNACNEEWAGVAGVVRADARKALLQACGFEPTDKGWQELREAAGRLEPGERDPQFRLVLQRIVESTPDEAGAAPVLSLIAGRPIENWLDEDIDRFPERARTIGEPVRQAVARMAEAENAANPLSGLSKRQAGAARKLANELKSELAARTDKKDEVLRAALLLLARELSGEGGAPPGE